jgi:NDP-sugar pyrophosphorylase family protein
MTAPTPSASTIATAVILAGGLGTRLRSAVPDRPKVMAEVGGRPFVEYLLDQLALHGVRSVVLCTGYLAGMVEERLGPRYRSLALRYSREPKPLGTGGALRHALPLLDTSPVLVLNGDSYCDAPLTAFAQWHVGGGNAASLLLVRVDDARRFGRVVIDEAQRIVRFVEKSDEPGPGLVNAGVYVLEREMIASITPHGAVSLERDVFPGWIGRGLCGYPVPARMWDIGVPDAYAQADAELAASVAR